MSEPIKRSVILRCRKRLARFLLSIALPMTLLAACNQVSSNGCPPLVTYPAAFQQQAARELRAAGGNVQTLVTDYGKLRDACRAMK